jgi:hypothetical protein
MKLGKAIWFLALSLALAPAAVPAAPKTQTLACNVSHFVRAGGLELRSTAILVHNYDSGNAATVERITIRNVSGALVHDSGPAAGVLIPLNTDFAVPLDITTVPSGASYYLRTNHIWGNNSLPAADGGNEAGQAMSAVVQVSKEGKEELLVVRTRPRSRERIITPTGANEGAERSSDSGSCTRLPD